MEPIIIAVIAFLLVYAVYSMAFGSKNASSGAHTKHALDQIYQESLDDDRPQNEIDETIQVLKADIDDSFTLKILSYLPFGKQMVVNIVKAGLQHSAGVFVFIILALILVAMFAIAKYALSPLFIIAAIIVPLWIGKTIIKGRIRKRNDQFIDMFPDVLDMIVRSVRSGFPLNSAINMVSENMEDPVRGEFRQVADELALGRSLSESLERLALRIPEPDIRFFVVVLKIQQDTGGNLAEVISNLSNVIRKRKQLRLKIKAMTAEGRITGYILGALPVFMFGVLAYASPNHLEPFFESTLGYIWFGTSIGLVVLAQIIVRKMIDIDI